MNSSFSSHLPSYLVANIERSLLNTNIKGHFLIELVIITNS